MNRPPVDRIYLDHAATGWPKPTAVYETMDRFARNIGAAAGRGSYRSATAAGEIVLSCRRRLARLIGAADPRRVALFSNGTTALNAAIFGVVRPGDHVVTTAIEHNSVLRPLEWLRTTAGVTVDVVPCDREGQVDPQAVLDRVTPRTRLVAISHASNVTGAVQDVATIAAALRPTDSLLLCDAAQTLGYLPIDVTRDAIDLLAAPGHKGACGPLGTGLLAVSPKAESLLQPTTFGGTGSISESLRMPTELPTMLEPGNLNVTAIAGWDAALATLAAEDPSERANRSQQMADTLRQFLQPLNDVRVIGGRQLPIVSLTFSASEVSLIASLLDDEYGIEVRSGLHCAALIHEQLGTAPEGTLRVSGGHGTTPDQLQRCATAIAELLTELAPG